MEMRSEGKQEQTWIIDPKRSRVGYWFVYGLGILQLFGAGALVMYATSGVEVALAAVLATSSALFLSVARLLGARKGGLAYVAAADEVRLYGRNERDFVAVPRGSLLGIRPWRRTEQWGKESEAVLVWSLELPTRGGVSVLALEPPGLSETEEAALAVRNVLHLPLLTEEAEPASRSAPDPCVPLSPEGATTERGTPLIAQGAAQRNPVVAIAEPASLGSPAGTARDSTWDLRTGVRWALSGPILALAVFSLLSGSLLLAGVEKTEVLGFLFGPVAGLLGIALMVLWVIRGFGVERLVLREGRLEQSFRLGRCAWGRQEMALVRGEVTFRLRSRAAQGFALEVLCGGRMLIVGTGATAGCALPPGRLLEVGCELAARSGAGGG